MTLISRVAALTASLAFPMIAYGQTSSSPGGPPRTEQHPAHVRAEHEGSGGRFLSTAMGEHRYELTYSGRQFTSRDRMEGYLLYRAAGIAQANGSSWFVLLHLPGERGAQDHLAERVPSFGGAYRHWQPHWNYRLSEQGWQPWHPEWGAAFWADSLQFSNVEEFNVHAIIELRRGARTRGQPMAFNSTRVMRDLGPGFGSIDPAP